MALPTRVTRSSYIDPIEAAQREFDSMLGRWFGGRSEEGLFAPYCVDVREDADHIYVEAELPGFKKDDVDITMENNTLTISAERSSERRQGGNASQAQGAKGQNGGQGQIQGQGQGQGQMLLHERRYNRFQRSFTLPPTVDEQSVQAKLEEGLLTITLNKREETKPRKINIG